MCAVVQDYFQNLFSADDNTQNYMLEEVQPCVSEQKNEEILQPFTIEELKKPSLT